MRTVVALYNDLDAARAAIEELIDHGFLRDNISLVANDVEGEFARYTNKDFAPASEDVTAGEGAGFGAIVGALVGLGMALIPGIGPVLAAGPLASALIGGGVGAAAGAVTGGIVAGLVNLGVPEDEASIYAEGVRRGGTLLTVNVPDDRVDAAKEILNRHYPLDIHRQAQTYRDTGWTGYNPDAEPYTAEQLRQERLRSQKVETGQHQTLPLADDRVEAGMRNEATSGTTGSMSSGTSSTAASMGTTGSMSSGTSTSGQTTSGTGYENKGTPGSTSGYKNYDSYERDFQAHFNKNFANRGYTYDYYRPAYQYGYNLATSDYYRDTRDWSQVEAEARRQWESRNEGTWDQFKDAVREAWEQIKTAV